MNKKHSQLAQAMHSKHTLAVASYQLNLLVKLLQTQSETEQQSDLLFDLENIHFLAAEVTQQVNSVYQYASIYHQLPESSFSTSNLFQD